MAAAHDDCGEALAGLCQAYWYPIYAHLRRRGHSPAEAEDFTQSFFMRVVERKPFGNLTRDGGKFRSFLLKALDRMLVDEWRKLNAQKRGAGKVISLDDGEAEHRFAREPVDSRTPEAAFDQNFALALLEEVYRKLEAEFQGREALFAALKPCLAGSRAELPYTEVAARLGLSEGSVKTHVHRLRARFKTLLRQAVEQTVAGPQEVDEELRHLLRAVAGS